MQKIYGGIVWFVATLFVMYGFGLNTAAAVFASVIKTSLHAGNVGASLATGAFILGFAFMQIPAGYLLDKFNARYVVSLGVLLLACGNLAISFSNNLILFSICNFIQGVGASFAFIAAGVLISQWFPSKLFPILFGLTQTLSCIAAGVIHYYFTLALEIYSWNEVYQCLAVFGFILLLICLLLVKTPASFQREANVSLITSLKTIFKNRQILLCSLAAATSFGVLLSYAGFWYMPIQQYYSVNKIQSVIISSVIFAGIGIGTPLVGYFSNLVKSRVETIHLSLIVGTMTLLLGIYLPHFDIDTLVIIKIISFAIGFFLSGSMLFYTMVSEMSNNSIRGVALSVLNTAVFLMNTLMLFIPYLFVTTRSKEFFTYLWILPFFILFSLLLLYFIKDTFNVASAKEVLK